MWEIAIIAIEIPERKNLVVQGVRVKKVEIFSASMIKKEKPMLSVAALIEAQNRWVDHQIFQQHQMGLAGILGDCRFFIFY